MRKAVTIQNITLVFLDVSNSVEETSVKLLEAIIIAPTLDGDYFFEGSEFENLKKIELLG
jgi:hypothetical protein